MKRISHILENSAKLENKQTDIMLNGFAILKPGFLTHLDDFQNLLSNNGWKIVQKKRGTLTQEQAEALYKCHSDKPFYKDLCKYMSSGECFCCTCRKECNDPINDMAKLKDRVRDRWGEDEMKNAMHSSDSLENVKAESGVVFGVGGVTESYEDPYGDDDEFASDNLYNSHGSHPQENPSSYKTQIINELVSLYAEEINAFYQYWIVSDFLVGPERHNIEKKYKEYAMDELTDHAAKLLKRMNELYMTPDALLRLEDINKHAKAKYIVPSTSYKTTDSLSQNITAEINAIEHYKTVIKLTEGVDPVTNELLKDILADEYEHRTELEEFRADIEVASWSHMSVPSISSTNDYASDYDSYGFDIDDIG